MFKVGIERKQIVMCSFISDVKNTSQIPQAQMAVNGREISHHLHM